MFELLHKLIAITTFYRPPRDDPAAHLFRGDSALCWCNPTHSADICEMLHKQGLDYGYLK